MATSKRDGGMNKAKAASKKILERIRKLLKMADDVSSPNEAAIAARRAERLMAEHNLTNADMVTAHMGLDDFEESLHGPALKSFPVHLSLLAVGVAKYTGCRAKFGYAVGTIRKQILFQGEVGDLEICKYLFTYLSRTTDQLCDRSGVKHIGPRTSFKKGCVISIIDTLARMSKEDKASDEVKSNGKSLMVVNKKGGFMNTKFGRVKYSRSATSVSSARAAKAGREAGRGVSIHKAVNSSNNTRRLS